MEKLRKFLGIFIFIAKALFIVPMGLVLLLLIVTPLMFPSDVDAIRSSGFAGPNSGLAIIGMCGIFIGLTTLIPGLRGIYSFFPWLFSFVKIFFVTLIILNIGLSILNYGYQTVNSTRHTVFFILMILFVAVGRLAMSMYFKWKPLNMEEEGIKE